MTIAAIATPEGRGGVGIIRISGEHARSIAETICGGKSLKPRYATYSAFYAPRQNSTNRANISCEVIDYGLAIYFPAPHSFTGEDITELHAHGSPILLEALLAATITLGARLALPGEFSERAFLNDKLDLTQAEAIADMINAASLQAAKAALTTLQGGMAARLAPITDAMLRLRVQLEGDLDFPDEMDGESAKASHAANAAAIADIRARLGALRAEINTTRRYNEGVRIALVGAPNAGKSSLLNALCAEDAAIVSRQAGTTRDVIERSVVWQGLPITLFDTAGLHESEDAIEQAGMARAETVAKTADLIILVTDATEKNDDNQELNQSLRAWNVDAIVIRALNKIDLIEDAEVKRAARDITHAAECTTLEISATEGAGLDALKAAVVAAFGDYEHHAVSARSRHVVCLNEALTSLEGVETMSAELAAEHLGESHDALGAIIGRVHNDALLGEIFRTFCIGK